MNPAIHQYTPLGASFVEAINPQRLHVDGADLDVEVGAEDGELDGAAPGIGRLDPAAVVIRGLFKHDGGIGGWIGLDGRGDDAAEFGHVVELGAEKGGTKGAEEAGVVVGHYAEGQSAGVVRRGEFWGIGHVGGFFAG